MIDFHTHILPGIDDGSQNVEMSIQMLHEELKNGVDHVVLTPHFYANYDSREHFLKRRGRSAEQLAAAIEKDGELSRMHYELGAEVYYFGGIGDAADVRKLCILDTDMLLLEMPFCQWTNVMYEDVEKLIRKQKLTIMLAHIERYIDFQKKKDVWNRIFELPVIAQINAGSFLDWRSRRRALRLADAQEKILLGSDAHNMDTRKPNLAAACPWIQKKLGEPFLWKQERLGYQLLGVQSGNNE